MLWHAKWKDGDVALPPGGLVSPISAPLGDFRVRCAPCSGSEQGGGS